MVTNTEYRLRRLNEDLTVVSKMIQSELSKVPVDQTKLLDLITTYDRMSREWLELSLEYTEEMKW